MAKQLFSTKLLGWLKDEKAKDLASLIDVFGERSIAVVILVLMLFPSLPIPTGGITHLLEIVAMILALEMIIGRKTIWLPKKLLNRNLGEVAQKKVIPFMLKRIKWFERHSINWGKSYLDNLLFLRFAGIIILVLTISAFAAPPFSGLDTLPSFSVVLITIAIILGDMRFFIGGFVLGITGLAAYLFFGAIIIDSLQNLIQSVF